MDKITVLYPGAFKPMHSGHIDLINRYSTLYGVNQIYIFIGKESRGHIDTEVALQVMEALFEDPYVWNTHIIKAEVVTDPTPMTSLYKFMETCQPGTYTLAASSKEAENTQRIKKFIENHNSGKYPLPSGVKVTNMPVNIEPLLYANRTDDNNGKPVSASILRQDIINKDIKNFKSNYSGFSDSTIGKIWSLLKYE